MPCSFSTAATWGTIAKRPSVDNPSETFWGEINGIIALIFLAAFM